MLNKLLPQKIFIALQNKIAISEITELRLRVQKPLVYCIGKAYFELNYTVEKQDLEQILGIASGNSMYAVNNALIKGYLPYLGGIRIGVSGEGVVKEDRLSTVKNINFMCISVPHEVLNCGKSLVGEEFCNTLILSPPSGGKTTLMRDLIRLLSKKYQILVLDERNEISASFEGVPQLDIGVNTDVVIMPKLLAYENAIRSMRPQIIATDEIFGEKEIEALKDIIRSGIGVLATAHAKDVQSLVGKYNELANIFDKFVVLSTNPIGKICGVYTKGEKNC
ncbi:MAG: hypothetical protein RR454_05580 [Clostridia bacterium]